VRKRKKPKGRFETKRLTGVELRMIDRATEDFPALRPVLYEALTAMKQPEAKEIFARVSPAQRAAMLVTLRKAGRALLERKCCDLCDQTATRVRFVVVRKDVTPRTTERPAGTDALSVFTILCDQCALIPLAQRKRKVLEKFTRELARGRSMPSHRLAIIGQAVGGAANLGPRSALHECEECSKPIWFDQDRLDRYGESRSNVAFLCTSCAQQVIAAGGLECLPPDLIVPEHRDSA
jgi:hypothetical protein